jgi:hypothetical protein
VYAQLRVSNFSSISNTANASAFLDASSNSAYNGTANIGKGLVFPRTDLSTFTFSPSTAIGTAINYPTRFDGMIVYNTKTGGAAGQGNTEGELAPGFWYYDNKTTTLLGGTWKPLGGKDAPGSWIYCPPFAVEWTSGTTGKTVNLFAEYSNGLSGYTTSAGSKITTGATGVNNLVSTATDFEYLVRYSGSSITITDISAAGVLTYDCNTTAPSNTDFISVILIRK